MNDLDPDYMREELAAYPAFREWLNVSEPGWQLEYSGHTLEQLEAWKAGMKWARGAVLEEAYMIARGGEKRFEKHGTKQLYWKGRSDAAEEIRKAKTK